MVCSQREFTETDFVFFFFIFFFWFAPFGYLYFHKFSIVIASIAYNHPVYGARIRTHNHSVVNPRSPLTTRPWLLACLFYFRIINKYTQQSIVSFFKKSVEFGTTFCWNLEFVNKVVGRPGNFFFGVEFGTSLFRNL